MAMLHLNLRAKYFDEIVCGIKTEEYRLVTPYWRRRLEGKAFEGIVLKKGYPKRGDSARTATRPWRGLTIKTLTHEHFGPTPVEVFAIRVA